MTAHLNGNKIVSLTFDHGALRLSEGNRQERQWDYSDLFKITSPENIKPFVYGGLIPDNVHDALLSRSTVKDFGNYTPIAEDSALNEKPICRSFWRNFCQLIRQGVSRSFFSHRAVPQCCRVYEDNPIASNST